MKNTKSARWSGFTGEELENLILMCREDGDTKSEMYRAACAELKKRWGIKI